MLRSVEKAVNLYLTSHCVTSVLIQGGSKAEKGGLVAVVLGEMLQQ